MSVINLYNDAFQNFKNYRLPKAQLVITDIPYNIGCNAYASSPRWYKNRSVSEGKSSKAGKQFFDLDEGFDIRGYLETASALLKPEPTEKSIPGRSSDAPAVITFCAFEQMHELIENARDLGFKHAIPLIFIKATSPQALKANMKIVGATEYAILLYREKTPKFRNGSKIDPDTGRCIRGTGRMIKNWFNWSRDSKEIPRIHPTQKPVGLLKELIRINTDPGDVVIDLCAGSGSTARACQELNRDFYGFEIDVKMYYTALFDMLKEGGE